MLLKCFPRWAHAGLAGTLWLALACGVAAQQAEPLRSPSAAAGNPIRLEAGAPRVEMDVPQQPTPAVRPEQPTAATPAMPRTTAQILSTSGKGSLSFGASRQPAEPLRPAASEPLGPAASEALGPARTEALGSAATATGAAPDVVPGATPGTPSPADPLSRPAEVAAERPAETPAELPAGPPAELPAEVSPGEPSVDVELSAGENAGAQPPEAAASEPAGGEPLEPIAAPENAGPVEIEAASFKGVTPGVTTADELAKTWGPPKEIARQGAALLHLYAVEPFERVEVCFAEDKVASIVIRLNQSFPAPTVAEQLSLSAIKPVLVSNELGEILGQAYPERGVLFAFTPSEEPGKASMQVAHIILEPINAEPFVLRAETNLETQPQASLEDLDRALKLQPDDARAYWLKCRVDAAMGRMDEALAAGAEAVRLEPSNARYRVTRGQVLGQTGQLAEALAEAQQAVATAADRPHVKARALCLLGDLTASTAKPDYAKALEYHTEAVKQADMLTVSPHPAVRLAAKEVMIDAHLGAAHDIAWGEWKQKEASIARWLERARAFADDMVANEGASEEHRFRVTTRALGAYVGLHGSLDPGTWADEAVRAGKSLVAGTQDPIRQAQYQWDLGMALYDALQIYQMRGDHDAALKYGEWAIDYLEQGERQRSTPTTAYLLGRLYFRLGAIHAIRDENHRVAITWFDKAIPLLDQPLPKEAMADVGRHGETFVSMGVSYWESGQKDRAVDLTRKGVGIMEQAVKQGLLDQSALAIPYGNLAAMNRQLGAHADAERYQQMATRVKTSATK